MSEPHRVVVTDSLCASQMGQNVLRRTFFHVLAGGTTVSVFHCVFSLSFQFARALFSPSLRCYVSLHDSSPNTECD